MDLCEMRRYDPLENLKISGKRGSGRTVKVDLLKIDEKFAFIYRCQNSSISMEIRGPFLKTGLPINIKE